MARRMPRSVVVTALLCGVVTAASLAGAAVLKARSQRVATPPSTSVSVPPTTPSVGLSGCLREPCQVLASTTVAGTFVELIADAGATSGRLRIGGPSASQVIETTVTDLGVTLTATSLQCVPGSASACLIRGEGPDGMTGQVVVGRSDKWNAQERAYLSSAGLLVLNNVVSDSSPEVIAAQYDCKGNQVCDKRPVYAQVFGLSGQEIGCTRTYTRLEQLPGYPQVTVPSAQLRDCP
ncbi:hypothetical protein SAMN05192558_1215 [Actinokineospora alba]|uniref:Uncharacterized protein n=1 Tax=Actinokineospora alba TaxID=504798 RepID=A0A1H0WFH5_9PSEU|nr:hypothetical protein [Actinokineospora alba]TDP65283.1 hypothetical protein C8E96_0763 [Actinokineospora alba]SDH58813.1 hypothetical protein SAMN05421871_101585 [Actinokineospora alba]SDP89480.1 hypothetical protein SAMN05192558_1215 [Actinokineospora alba]